MIRTLIVNIRRTMTTFPVHGLLPKQETQALNFIKETSYDGTGIVIAILDTGVDVGAPGLQFTTDGRIKIVDAIDCTGSGDCDVSKVVALPDNRQLMGLSGRCLTVPADWNVPSGMVRLGVKNVFELYPKSLIGRLREVKRVRVD
jgi:tripeptidyl-peptidase II